MINRWQIRALRPGLKSAVLSEIKNGSRHYQVDQRGDHVLQPSLIISSLKGLDLKVKVSLCERRVFYDFLTGLLHKLFRSRHPNDNFIEPSKQGPFQEFKPDVLSVMEKTSPYFECQTNSVSNNLFRCRFVYLHRAASSLVKAVRRIVADSQFEVCRGLVRKIFRFMRNLFSFIPSHSVPIYYKLILNFSYPIYIYIYEIIYRRVYSDCYRNANYKG